MSALTLREQGEIRLLQSSNDWFWKVIPAVISGFVMFLITKLYDAAQFEKRIAALTEAFNDKFNHLASKEEMRSMFVEFEANRVVPLRERVSKSDNEISTIRSEISTVRDIVTRIAAKLEVQGR